MIEIYPNLFIGDETDYYSKVSHEPDWFVVHACKEPFHRKALGYKGRAAPKTHPEYLIARRGNRLILNLIDVDDPDYIPKEIIDAALAFIEESLPKGKVLVHCNLGKSRAPTIGLLYLVKHTEKIHSQELATSKKEFEKIYPMYQPSPGMYGFLKIHWEEYSRA